MNVEDVRDFCLSLPHTEEYTPFDDVTLCFKVGGLEKGKIFALLSLDKIPPSINLKAEPEEAISLRENYPQIIPGYHMNKKHWNTVYFEDGLTPKLIKELIEKSYHLVFNSLTAKLRNELKEIK